MRDSPILLIVVALLGLSGLMVFSGTSPKPQSEAAPAPRAGATDSSAASCENDPVLGILCRYFGEQRGAAAIARFQGADSRVVIASVPDPLDSEVGFGFEQRLDALRKAALTAGLTPDRFYLPWLDGKGAARAVTDPPTVTPRARRTA